MVRRLAVVLFTAALTAVLTAAPAHAADDDIDYVALGDSYAAGTGAAGATGSCQRSRYGYPQLWAAANDPASFRSVACSGAETSDVRRTQVQAVSRTTDLVTVTVGGNDAGFVPTFVTCLVGSDAICVKATKLARAYIRTVLPAKLDATYAAIRERAPDARVVVLAYPRLYDTDAAACEMSPAKRRALNAGSDDLATVQRARAARAGFTFVDVRDAFAGHGICAPAAWLNPLTVFNPVASFHPTATGYREGYLPELSAALD